MKLGEITPICLMECVPGDKFNITSTNLLRFAPLLSPVMHQSSVYIHYFFVPNRILWPKGFSSTGDQVKGWEDFISGGEDGLSEPAFPTISPPSGFDTISSGSIWDYLGLPTGATAAATGTSYLGESFSALPIAAYNKIYNEYYRDQNLVTTPLPDSLIDGDNTALIYSDGVSYKSGMQKRAWQHDYFTSALPFTQKGPEATIPLGTQAPLIYGDYGSTANTDLTYLREPYSVDPTGYLGGQDGNVITNGVGMLRYPDGTASAANWDVTNTHVADLSQASASSINDLRRAFRLQEWLERNARGGSRYIEIIMAHFGVKSSDSRLQRPEFLGGSATPVTISEVLQTSDNAAENTPQANMAGHGVSVGASKKVSYFCEEHGLIMGLMTVMPKSAYQQGLPKLYKKYDKFDYFWPAFQSIGEQPIYNEELYFDASDNNNDGIFGYTPRYAEYKYIPSSVHGEFRNTLNFWHMGRIFDTRPSLNQDFIEMDNTEVERIFAVNQDAENLYVYLHNKVEATRPMVYFGTPTI
tara:strand:+ start:1575 stop:3152 length:1578 start_codon:yes stop_codon:yes gene_type:complete